MRPWQFSRPKGPGFGINRNYYLSAFIAEPILPALLDLLNPKGERGAMSGFGVPLAAHASKSDLSLPMARGNYALATRDRKTVLRMLVMLPSDMGFDVAGFRSQSAARILRPEVVDRVSHTSTVAQLTFESHDAEVYPALDFFLGIAQRLAHLTNGVVADPISRRYLMPEEIFRMDRVHPTVDAREHVAIHTFPRPGGLTVYTLGMQKFTMPEFELQGLPDSEIVEAGRLITVLAQRVLMGDPFQSGDQVGADQAPFEIREGGFDRALWSGTPVFELLPPTTISPAEALQAWVRSL